MIGFVIGTICLVGLVKMARRGACGYGGGCGYGGYGGYGGGYGGSCGGGGGSCGGGSCGHGGGWRGRWHGHHHGHHHGGGWGGPPWAREHGHEQHGGGGFGGPWMFQRAILRQLFERLETTPGQEKVIIAAVEEARTAGRKAWEALRDSREEVARSISGETFDEAAMGSAFAKQDEAISEARRAMMNALTKVHEALDSRQRAALSDILARGPRAWGRYGGPYRT